MTEANQMKKPDMQLLQQLFRTTTWGNTTETARDWKDLLEGDDENAKKRLFNTLFLELPNPAPLRSLFDEEHIRAYLADYQRQFNRSHLERRRKYALGQRKTFSCVVVCRMFVLFVGILIPQLSKGAYFW